MLIVCVSMDRHSRARNCLCWYFNCLCWYFFTSRVIFNLAWTPHVSLLIFCMIYFHWKFWELREKMQFQMVGYISLLLISVFNRFWLFSNANTKHKFPVFSQVKHHLPQSSLIAVFRLAIKRSAAIRIAARDCIAQWILRKPVWCNYFD